MTSKPLKRFLFEILELKFRVSLMAISLHVKKSTAVETENEGQYRRETQSSRLIRIILICSCTDAVGCMQH